MAASALIRKPLLNPARRSRRQTITIPGRCCAIFRRRPSCGLCPPTASALPALLCPPSPRRRRTWT